MSRSFLVTSQIYFRFGFIPRVAVHAVGIGVFGRNVDVEVKSRGVISRAEQDVAESR